MEKDKDNKKIVMIDPMVSPTENWELYCIAMGIDPNKIVIETEYKYKKNKTPKK